MPEEIDIRKRYMTRGRAKVFQLERREDGYLYGIIDDGAGWCVWRSNGSMLPNEEHDLDLIPATSDHARPALKDGFHGEKKMNNDREQQFAFIMSEKPDGVVEGLKAVSARGWRVIGGVIPHEGKLLAFLQRDKPYGDEAF